jgi:hypothetical protein
MAIRKDARLSYKSAAKTGRYILNDLIIKKPDSAILDIKATPVDVQAVFTADVGDTAWKKYYVPIIDKEAQRYQKIIETEASALAKKIAGLKKSGNLDDAKKMVDSTTASINMALKTLDTQLPSLIQKELDKQAKRDRKLLKARIKVVYKASRIVLSVGASIAKLVGSGGAEVSSYYNIAKQLRDAGMLIQQQAKGEKKLRQDLHKGYKAFLDSAADDSSASAESALKAYRNHSTKTKNRILSAAKQADGFQVAMKKAKDLKGGVKLGAKTMTAKKEAGRLVEKYNETEAYADEFENCLADSQRKLKAFVEKELAGKYDKLVVQKDKSLNEFLAYAEKFLDEVDGIMGDLGDIMG